MNELFTHIAYLLRHHDCVILAGVGAFVAVGQGAEFNAANATFMPPRRDITFNSAIRSDDGLLSNSVARRRRISYAQASAIVAEQTAEVVRRLAIEGSVCIESVGTLSRDSEGFISFTPELQPMALRLPDLRLRHFVPAPVISLEIEHRSNERTVAVVRMPLHRKVLAFAASVALLIGVGLTLSTPIDVNTAHTAAIGSIGFTAPAEPSIDPLPVPSGLRLAMGMPGDGSVLPVPTKPAPEAPVRYVMVVASFPSAAQAQSFMAASGDTRLNFFEKDGKFRVYIAGGSTQSEVQERAASIADLRDLYPDAWVCRK